MAATTSPSPLTPNRTDPLNAALGTRIWLRWQTLVFVLIFIAAVFTRLYGLGDRAMSHDESLHVFYSWNLYMKGDFDHTPLMHGPIMFHVNALFYALFGDNDFSGRLYAAFLGIAMVMSPLLFKRWLGKWGTILACLMILISPLLLYYNRYIREDTPAIMASILMAWSALTYISGAPEERRKPRYLYILSAAMLWNLGSKESAFFYVAIFGLFLTGYWLFRIVQTRWQIAGRQWFTGLLLATVCGGTIAIAMYTILDITPLNDVLAQVVTDPVTGMTTNAATGAYIDPAAQAITSRSFVLWTAAAVLTVVAGMAGTMLWAFRKKLSRVPWREFIIIVATALIVLLAFIVVEERSHVTREDLGIAAPLDPNAQDGDLVSAANMSPIWILMPWGVMIGSLVLFYISRRKNAEGRDWWDWLYQFPELDVLWIMGTLVLPWLTAIFIVGARGTQEQFASIGAGFSFLVGILPTGSSNASVGQFMVGFLCWLPLMITSIAAGLTWNWRRFLVCWLIFHGLFAFFFTTVFTNIQGFATGMIYSLQYWLEQQAERRGSQPQYYYTLIIMPMYEFLPIIGAAASALVGSFIYWKRRARIQTLEAHEQADIRQNALLAVGTGDAAVIIADGDGAAGTALVPTDDPGIARRRARRQAELVRLNQLTEVPFLLFVAFWAVLNIIVFTLAGEKMPWLGTHMTLPMILLAAWFFGRIFDKIDMALLKKIGWVNLLIYPLGIAAVFQLLVLQFTGQGPFQGVEQFQLTWTYAWLAAAVVAIAVVWGIQWLGKITGSRHSRQLFAVAVFSVLSLVTFRSAWMASFINYDYPNEFLVYAHATSGTKVMMNMLEDLSRRTTDGMGIKFAYDNKLSWPGAWYFRHFTNAIYMGDTPQLPQMEESMVVIVGDNNLSVVEPLLEERYQRFDFKRMWWPMQNYFDLNATRIIDLFALEDTPGRVGDYPSAKMRHGLWDIFWQRDYTKYGEAIGTTFKFETWPVSENMYFYVRKDFAVAVWPYGIGDGSVTNPINTVEASACITNWQQSLPALTVFDTGSVEGGRLLTPIALDASSDGRVFVAEDAGSRISEFTTDGMFVRSFGQPGQANETGAFFNRPHSVEVAPDGSIVVVDTWNYRIRVFNAQLEQIAVWGQGVTVGNNAPPEPVDGFWGPRDVAIGMDNLVYISDTGNKRVRVYTLQGEWVRDIGRGGPGEGELNEPTGLAVHSDGRLFVADTWNRRIAVFAADGSWLANYQVRAWYDELGNRPYLALDEARGLLYITDPDGGRVLVYNTDGACVGAFGRLNRESPGDSEFATIGGIDTDADGNVYVVDLSTGRILKFAPFAVPVTAEGEGLDTLPEGLGQPVIIQPEMTLEEVQPEEPQG